jgi:hypothetical protein
MAAIAFLGVVSASPSKILWFDKELCSIGATSYCIRATAAKDSPVTLRGGSLLAISRPGLVSQGWLPVTASGQVVVGKEFQATLSDPTFKNFLVLNENDGDDNPSVTEVSKSKQVAWEVTMLDRSGASQGLELCSDVQSPLPKTGDPCVKPGTPIDTQTPSIYLFVMNFSQTKNDLTKDVIENEDADDDAANTIHYRVLFHHKPSVEHDYVVKDKGITYTDANGNLDYQGCKNSTCSIRLSNVN